MVERFVELDQFIDKQLSILVMHIVIAGSMHDQQIAPETHCKVLRRAFNYTLPHFSAGRPMYLSV